MHSPIGRLLGSMIAKSEQFCGNKTILRESTAEYFLIGDQ